MSYEDNQETTETEALEPARPLAPQVLPPVMAVPAPMRADAAAQSGLMDMLGALWRRKLLILAVAALSGTIALALSLWVTPTYRAGAALEIQAENQNFLNMRDIDPNIADNNPESSIETQVRILQDDAIAERVIDNLKLTDRPPFSTPPPPSFLGRWFGRKAPVQSPHARALASLHKNLKVRPSGQTRIVEIFYDAPDPNIAAAIANAFSKQYIDKSMAWHLEAAQSTLEWLNPQLRELKAKLEKSDDQLQAYARSAGLMFMSQQGSIDEDKLRRLQEELSKAHADRLLKQTRAEVATSHSTDSLPEILDSPQLRESRARLDELKRQYADLSASFTPAYYKVKNLKAQITELETSIARQRDEILQRIRNERDASQRLENLLSKAYSDQSRVVTDQSSKAIQYNIIKREVDSNRSLYDAMLQKAKEAAIASAARASNIRVIHNATPPERPYRPDPPLNTALATVAGLMLGIVCVLAFENKDRSLKSPADLSFYLQVPALGAVPRASRPWVTIRRAEMKSLEPSGRNAVEMAALSRRPSPLGESLRATLTSLLVGNGTANGQRPRAIVVTSCNPGEGKTMITSNLGIALARTNHVVLLIDADFHKPRLHEIFGLANDWGLSDYLKEELPIEDYPFETLVRRTRIPGVFVLPSGHDRDASSDLLYSARMSELLWRFRLEFHTVLVDTPPVLATPDARLLGQMVDGAVLVVRAGTSREDAQAVNARLREDGIPILGAVLNQLDPSQGAYYSYTKARSAAAGSGGAGLDG